LAQAPTSIAAAQERSGKNADRGDVAAETVAGVDCGVRRGTPSSGVELVGLLLPPPPLVPVPLPHPLNGPMVRNSAPTDATDHVLTMKIIDSSFTAVMTRGVLR
jgi:hypothetical protein